VVTKLLVQNCMLIAREGRVPTVDPTSARRASLISWMQSGVSLGMCHTVGTVLYCTVPAGSVTRSRHETCQKVAQNEKTLQ
jgi:hypothetical protein